MSGLTTRVSHAITHEGYVEDECLWDSVFPHKDANEVAHHEHPRIDGISS